MDGVKFQASVLTICSDSGRMCVTLGIRYYRYGRGSKPYHPWSIHKNMHKWQVVLGHSSIHSQEARIKPLICNSLVPYCRTTAERSIPFFWAIPMSRGTDNRGGGAGQAHKSEVPVWSKQAISVFPWCRGRTWIFSSQWARVEEPSANIIRICAIRWLFCGIMAACKSSTS